MIASLDLARVSGMLRCNGWARGVDPSAQDRSFLTPYIIQKENLRRIRDELIRRRVLPRGYESIDPQDLQEQMEKYQQRHRGR